MFASKNNKVVRNGARLTSLALCLSVTGFANAHPGDFNKHFGAAGTAAIPTSVRFGGEERIAVDSSDRILLGYNVDPHAAEISALDASGHVDTTFGTAGVVECGDLYDIKVDSLDRYVVLGHAASSDRGVMVMRYLNNGSLDTSFGTGGVATVTTDINYGANALALDASDNIVVAGGRSTRTSENELYATRVLNNGTLDTSFGKNGFRSVALGSPGTVAIAQAVAIDHSGNIYVTGYSSSPSAVVNQLIKLKGDGSLDKHFGGGSGVVTTDFNPSTAFHFTFAQSVTVDAKDNVVIAGGAGDYAASETFVGRFLSNGLLDPAFNGGAYSVFPIEASVQSQARSALIDTRGRIVLTGIANDGGADASDFFAVRLQKDGRLDPGFAGGILPTGGWKGAGALTNNGNVLVFGESLSPTSVVVDELKGNSAPSSASLSDEVEE